MLTVLLPLWKTLCCIATELMCAQSIKRMVENLSRFFKNQGWKGSCSWVAKKPDIG